MAREARFMPDNGGWCIRVQGLPEPVVGELFDVIRKEQKPTRVRVTKIMQILEPGDVFLCGFRNLNAKEIRDGIMDTADDIRQKATKLKELLQNKAKPVEPVNDPKGAEAFLSEPFPFDDID